MCVHARAYVCVYVCVYVCIRACMYACMYLFLRVLFVSIFAWMCLAACFISYLCDSLLSTQVASLRDKALQFDKKEMGKLERLRTLQLLMAEGDTASDKQGPPLFPWSSPRKASAYSGVPYGLPEVLGDYDNCVHEKDWCCRKRGTQAT